MDKQEIIEGKTTKLIRRIKTRTFNNRRAHPFLVARAISKATTKIVKGMLDKVCNEHILLKFVVSPRELKKYRDKVYEAQTRAAEKILGKKDVYGITDEEIPETEYFSAEDALPDTLPADEFDRDQSRFYSYCRKIAEGQQDAIRGTLRIYKVTGGKNTAYFLSLPTRIRFDVFLDIIRPLGRISWDEIANQRRIFSGEATSVLENAKRRTCTPIVLYINVPAENSHDQAY